MYVCVVVYPRSQLRRRHATNAQLPGALTNLPSVPSNVVVPLGVPPAFNPDLGGGGKKEAGATQEAWGAGGEGGGGKGGRKSPSYGDGDDDDEDAEGEPPKILLGHEGAEKILHKKIMGRHDPMAVQKTDWGMVHPLSNFMKYWDIATLFLLLFTAVVTPFEVAFVEDVPLSPMYFVNLLVNLAFLFDLVGLYKLNPVYP
jgi:hypothetical protein